MQIYVYKCYNYYKMLTNVVMAFCLKIEFALNVNKFKFSKHSFPANTDTNKYFFYTIFI